MQTSDKRGIVCDHCGTSHNGDFIYYSFDFHNVNVLNNRRPDIDSILRSTVIFSLDICQICFDDISKVVIENYKKQMTSKKNAGIICEISGTHLVGTYSYYYINCSKVSVKMTGQPNMCTGCHTKTWNDKPCEKCGGTKFIKPALINAFKRYLEIVVSESAFVALRKKSESIRQTASQWTTGD